jgi:hypothetical protein
MQFDRVIDVFLAPNNDMLHAEQMRDRVAERGRLSLVERAREIQRGAPVRPKLEGTQGST